MIKEKLAKKESKLFIYVLLSMLMLSIIIIVSVFFKGNIQDNSLELTLEFIKFFNCIISVLGVGSCLISYKKSNNESIFILSLMYLMLSIGIFCGHIDFLPFYAKELTLSTYIVVSASIFRIFLLVLSVLPSCKLRTIIINNKAFSFLLSILIPIVFGTIERSLGVFGSEEIYDFFIFYNIFLCITYTICTLKLLEKAIKEKEYIFVVLSSSIFVLAIKAVYAIYILNRLSFYTKLISVSLTYICFLIIIIGALIELYMHISKCKILNKNLNLLYDLVDNGKHCYMLIFDENKNLLYANQKVKEYYLGENYNNTNKLESIIKSKAEIFRNNKDVLDGLDKDGVWRGILKDKENSITIDCCIQWISSEENKKGIGITFRDITDIINKDLEVERLKIYDKEKSEFIANISHELKTPLNIFYSSVQLLDKFIENKNEDFRLIYKKYNKILHTNCKRMTRLVNNIMDLSNMDIGIIKADFKNYNIVSIVEEVTLSIVDYALLKSINIQFDTDMEEYIIKCDSSMIERVMLNLLSNAIKFSYENTNILVNVNIRCDCIEIDIHDEGIGISQQDKEIIFEKFVQLDKSFTRKNEGSGIGLSIVKSIVNLHEGSISVDSSISKGTTVKILLPNAIIEDSMLFDYDIDKHNIELELSDIYEVLT